jgi:hypothetical protein
MVQCAATMRIKNAGKTKDQDRSTGKTPANRCNRLMEIRQEFRYGEHFNPDRSEDDFTALEAIRALHFALNLKSKVAPPRPFNKKSLDEYQKHFWQHVTINYERSFKTHDATFFRRLADAMEAWLCSNDPVWTHITDELIVCKLAKRKFPTVSEMQDGLANIGLKPNRKTVERAYVFWGVPRDAKRGAKLGTKQKLRHQAHR